MHDFRPCAGAPTTEMREEMGDDSFRAWLLLVRRRADDRDGRRNGGKLVSCIIFARAQAPTTEVREENGERLVLDNLQGCLIKTMKI